MKTCIVLVSCPEAKTAETVATALINEKLAACVNILHGMTSIYRWQGATERSEECLLIIKTEMEKIPDLEPRLLELHPYDTPEFVVLDTLYVNQRYADWVESAVTRD